MTKQEKRDRLVKRLRERLDLTDEWGVFVSDEDILLGTEKTFTRASVELGLALSDLGTEIGKPIRKLLRKAGVLK